MVIPALTLWSSNGPLTSLLIACSLPNVLIVMVSNLLLLSELFLIALHKRRRKVQEEIRLGNVLIFKCQRSNDDQRFV